MLMRRWERARQANGQLVLIVGEPGLGKSRVIEDFRARLREVPHTWVEWIARSFCRTRHCIQSQNGDAKGSAVLKSQQSSD
jgi:predicted ATPase